MAVVAGDDVYKSVEDNQPVHLTLAEFKDFTRDLNLLEDSVQLLGSNLLASRTTFYYYRDRKRI